MNATAESYAAEGEVVGKFRIGKRLAVGSMSVVVQARHLELDEQVAIKILHPNLASPRFTARFIREARNAARIKSEHAPRFIDVGWLRGGLPYLVMEYLEGQTLARLIDVGKELPIPDAVDHVLEACEAVGAAHVNGILHRDLKPSNLFLASRLDGTPLIKVLDFGVSRAFNSSGEREDEGLTIADVTLGAHDYKAPEQVLGRDVDARCDVWALGAILYTLLTLRAPFPGGSVQDVIKGILQASPLPPRMVRPAIPPDLEAVILRCLQVDREKRPASVGKLALFLQQHASERARHLPMSILKAGRRARRLSGAPAEREVDALVVRDVEAPEIEVLFDATEYTASEALLAPSLPRPAPTFPSISHRPSRPAQPSMPPTRAPSSKWLVAVACVALIAILLSLATIAYRGLRGEPPAVQASADTAAPSRVTVDAVSPPTLARAVAAVPVASEDPVKLEAPPSAQAPQPANPPVSPSTGVGTPAGSAAMAPKGRWVRAPTSASPTRPRAPSARGAPDSDPWGWER